MSWFLHDVAALPDTKRDLVLFQMPKDRLYHDVQTKVGLMDESNIILSVRYKDCLPPIRLRYPKDRLRFLHAILKVQNHKYATHS